MRSLNPPRRLMRIVGVGLCLVGASAAGCLLWPAATPVELVPPPPGPKQEPPPAPDAFVELAKADPVAMFAACMNRYEREVKGFRATLEKQERVAGKLCDREIVQVIVAGEVPDQLGAQPQIQVRMVWEQGFRKGGIGLTFPVHGVLYPAGERNNELLTFRPKAILTKEAGIGPKSDDARGASRYCVTDSGIYRGMLRTYTAWKKLPPGGLRTEYLGKEPVEKAGGRVCHIIRRTCAQPEVDSFALDEKAAVAPKVIERDGFSEVTVMIDAETWLHVGTVLKRANGDLIGEYYFRNVEIVADPAQIPPDTFTPQGLIGASKK